MLIFALILTNMALFGTKTAITNDLNGIFKFCFQFLVDFDLFFHIYNGFLPILIFQPVRLQKVVPKPSKFCDVIVSRDMIETSSNFV